MINLPQILDQFRNDDAFMRDVVHWHTLPGRTGSYVDFPLELDARLVRVLQARGIRQMYSHQREAWDVIKAGKSPVIVTPTASGKTLCYNLPVLSTIAAHPDARALYLFPTKALGQDQMDEIVSTIDALDLDIKTAIRQVMRVRKSVLPGIS